MLHLIAWFMDLCSMARVLCVHTSHNPGAACCRYRGYIERVNPQEPRFEVYFIDFGNKEKLNTEDVRPLDAALSAVPAQARPACLAYVKVSHQLLLTAETSGCVASGHGVHARADTVSACTECSQQAWVTVAAMG